MTELELTRRVVEIAAKFLDAKPACVREVAVCLSPSVFDGLTMSDIGRIQAVIRDAIRTGWTAHGAEGFNRGDVIETRFYAPKTDTH